MLEKVGDFALGDVRVSRHKNVATVVRLKLLCNSLSVFLPFFSPPSKDARITLTWQEHPNVGALILGIGFGGRLYHSYKM